MDLRSGRVRAGIVALSIGAIGLPVLSSAAPGNDDRAAATLIPVTPAALAFDLAEALPGPSEGSCLTTRQTTIAQNPAGDPLTLPAMHVVEPAPGVWFRFVAPTDGTLTFGIEGPSNTTITVYDEAAVTPRACRTSDDHVQVTAGDAIDLVLATPPMDSLEQLTHAGLLHTAFVPAAPIANDELATAATLPAGEPVEIATFGAELDEVACGARPAVWYRHTATADAVFDVTLEVARTSTTRPTIVAFDADGGELACEVGNSRKGGSLFEVVGGSEILFGIGPADAVLRLELEPSRIPDAFADPLELGSDPVAFSTAAADAEPGEDVACGGARSLWFRLPAADEERVLRASGLPLSGAGTFGMQLHPDGACATNRALRIPPGQDALVRIASSGPVLGRLSIGSAAIPALQLTDASPLAPGCASMNGIRRGSEVEPHLAISPVDPDHLIASWQQDRDSNGGALTLMTATSFDGGRTWTASHPGGVSQCGCGKYTRASDPWVSIGSDGVAHLTTLGVGGPATESNAILVQRSFDGGLTWEAPATVSVERGLLSNDKQVLLVDPNDPQKVYLAWALVLGGALRSVLARSLDGGDTWLPPIPLPTAAPGLPIGDQLAITDDGDLVHVVNHSALGYVQAMRSRDGGVTWLPPVRLGPSTSAEGPPGVRGGNMMPDVATDGTRVAVTWLDGEQLWLATSDADVTTWEARPIASATGRFTPSIAVTRSGEIAITTYRFEGSSVVMTQLTERDGGFVERVVSEPFAIELAPNIPGRGWFLGDYTGLVARGDGFVSLHAMTLDGDTDLYVQHLPA